MYEHIEESSEKSGRHGDRAEEVAARTVLKHHKAEGTKKASSLFRARKFVAQKGGHVWSLFCATI
jgi:hypothetical protein